MLTKEKTLDAIAISFASSAVPSSVLPLEAETGLKASVDETAGNVASALITKFEIIAKFGLPRPVAASHPGLAAKEYSQQLTSSIPCPAQQAYKYTII